MEASKKRGRPPGSKNKKAEAPGEPEALPDIEEVPASLAEPAVPAEAPEPEAPEEPEAPAEPIEAPATAVKMKKPRAQKPPPRAARPNTPHPTAADIAREMVNVMDDRHHDRMLARKAMYSSWV